MSKTVIVGGVAGGATAGARLRRLDENAEIIIFEKSGYVSYANCGLPYYIGDVITERSALTLQTPESFKRRFNIDVRTLHEVTDIYPDKHKVLVKNLQTGEEFEESYDKLILSPGAHPIMPDTPGLDSANVFTLRTVEDTFRIKDHTEAHKPGTITIVGGGFIGLELAENFIEKGISVNLIQRSGQLMKQFDPEIAAFIHAKLRAKGVNLFLNESIVSVEEKASALELNLKNAGKNTCDMLIIAIGVEPESALAKKAGLSLGIRDSILVNENMQTSDPDIYAVGDAVQVKHFISGDDALISLAGPANRQGRIAADNICGIKSTYPGSQGTSVIKIFDQTFASTGINEKTASAKGINYDKVLLSPASHAGYYPGGSVMTMKVLWDKDTDKLLGAQIAGFDGVDKRIDVLATAMYAGVKASDLKELDLSYAPPYSSAKDPVNMAGFMIENVNEGIIKQFFYDDLESMCGDTNSAGDGHIATQSGAQCTPPTNKINSVSDDVTLLDARTPGEYEKGHVPGFVNIPVDELRDRINEIDKSKPVYVMCQSGLRSYIACRILEGHGFVTYNFAGGYRLYNVIKTEEEAAKNAAPCGAEG